MLHEKVKNQLRVSLEEFYPEWLKFQGEPLDQKRVLTPERVGAYKISIEPYHGLNSGIRSMALIPNYRSVQILKSTIDEFQASLVGYLAIPGQSTFIGDISRHIVCWCEYIDQKVKSSFSIQDAISDLIMDLDDTVSNSEMTREIFAPVDGLILGEDFDQINIDSDFEVRKLTMAELQELVSEDVMFSNGRSELFRSTSTVIIYKQKARFRLATFEEWSEPLPFDPNMYEPFEGLIACLHLLKPGKFSVIEYQHRFIPRVLPFQKFSTGSFRSNFLMPALQISKDEADSLKKLYLAYYSIEWPALKIAIRRLGDAENRMSPTDSLLDSIIGLEVLLNPVERSEIAFRVALHYSYLGEKAERKNRYDLMRKIQEIRNAIVHGGATIGSTRANEISIYSNHAKNCLREVILTLLNSGMVKGRKKIDSNFWLEFIMNE